VKVEFGNQLQRNVEKSRPMHLLLAGNDTVPSSVWYYYEYYVDEAYCYKRNSAVCRSVCL